MNHFKQFIHGHNGQEKINDIKTTLYVSQVLELQYFSINYLSPIYLIKTLCFRLCDLNFLSTIVLNSHLSHLNCFFVCLV